MERGGRRREQLLIALRKGDDAGNWNRQHCIALPGDLAWLGAMNLPSDRPRVDDGSWYKTMRRVSTNVAAWNPPFIVTEEIDAIPA